MLKTKDTFNTGLYDISKVGQQRKFAGEEMLDVWGTQDGNEGNKVFGMIHSFWDVTLH